MLSIEGWIEGIITLSILIFGSFSGLFFVYKSRKTKANLLLYMGLMIFFSSIIYLGVSLDFLTILLTSKNIDKTFQAVITYIWAPPVGFIGTIIGAELMFTKRKRLILISFLAMGLIYEILILINPSYSLTSVPIVNSGEYLIHTNVIFGRPLFFLLVFLFGYVFILVDFGFFYKGLKSREIVRKKYFLLSVGFTLYHVTLFFDAFSYPTVIIMRVCAFISFFFWYLGLKEEIITPKYIQPEKEVKVEDSLFRLSEIKPGEISEDEVTFFREQKICLVCKGEVKGFNYICSKCDALYCENCARTLTNLENACWVCNTPFDKTKPSKPFTKNGDYKEIKKLNNSKKGL